MRIMCQCYTSLLQNAYGHSKADRRKLTQERFQRIPFLNEIKKIFNGNARAAEHRCPALNFGIDNDERWSHTVLS